MKKIITLSLSAAIITTSLVAQTKFSGDVTITSNSIFRGASSSNDTPVTQVSLNVGLDNGVYFGFWGSGTASGSELDLITGYKTSISGFNINTGFAAYTTTQPATTKKWTFDQSGELYLGVSKTISGIDLGASIYEEVLAESTATTIEGSIGKDFDIVSASFATGYNIDTKVKYYNVALSKSIEMIKGSIALTLANQHKSMDDAVYGISYTTSF